MTEATITALAVLGVAAQAALVLLLVWPGARELVRGSELWLAFTVALVATARSLFFSEVAQFVPCKLCWFQRIAMYPLVLLALPALALDRRAARYFLPLPLAGLVVAGWHVLVERGVLEETASCEISAPGGCSVRWIEELGYVTIPTLAGTAFALVAVLLVLASRDA